jgi:hypothetical protein
MMTIFYYCKHLAHTLTVGFEDINEKNSLVRGQLPKSRVTLASHLPVLRA